MKLLIFSVLVFFYGLSITTKAAAANRALYSKGTRLVFSGHNVTKIKPRQLVVVNDSKFPEVRVQDERTREFFDVDASRMALTEGCVKSGLCVGDGVYFADQHWVYEATILGVFENGEWALVQTSGSITYKVPYGALASQQPIEGRSPNVGDDINYVGYKLRIKTAPVVGVFPLSLNTRRFIVMLPGGDLKITAIGEDGVVLADCSSRLTGE